MHTEDKKKNGDGSPSPGYELSDVNVSGTLVFVAGLLASVIVFFVVCWAMGKIMNAQLAKEDGPVNHWRQGGPQDSKGNLVSNPEMEQSKLGQLVNNFPSPRVQLDDGNQDVADLHAREDLYLEHYTWADAAHTTVRIPIERAMQLIVERSLPTAPTVQTDDAKFTGATVPVVTAPLTSGFARTAYEQEQIQTRREKMNEDAGSETASK
jgi:hypothetical protein